MWIRPSSETLSRAMWLCPAPACLHSAPALSLRSRWLAAAGNTNVILTIMTTKAIPASARAAGKLSLSTYWLWLPLPGRGFAGLPGNHSCRKKMAGYAALGLILLLVILLPACGGGLSGGGSGQPGTPQGNYSVTVTAAMGSLSHSVQAMLTVQP